MKSNDKTDAEKFVEDLQRSDNLSAKRHLEAMLRKKCIERIEKTLASRKD